jgi:hypothetical protein
MNFHIPETQSQVLAGKVGLVTGIASDESIVIGCARALRDVGAAAYTGSRSKRAPGGRRRHCGPGSSFALEAIRSTGPCNRYRPKQCRDRVRTSLGGPGCPLGAPRLEPHSRPRGMCRLSERRGWAYCTGQRPSASQRGDRGGRERGRSCMSPQAAKGTSVRLCYCRLEHSVSR